ncbi:hypothetical protein MNEG_6312 [Monoraphidium neglectum]|uniref:Uncharacterized protein n=1 Tax=Monoraphidium neglectum TaxID=145388 RepID=A0A0D2N729_9CHLO|nr:hypothetical protein MNEG_6312 [Monoraphidium neglectum]KIZ01646.1 hypothetical protein MNEG_6312 [Monoraphidium neglectum]|eukprot:XP_013900665.1 hypothetical protein MNEG_6312 [Monoraphidium neglectum]
MDDDGVVTVQSSMERNVDARNEKGAAQAVLEAIYGREFIRKFPGCLSLEALQRRGNSVTALVGCGKRINEGSAKEFRKQLGVYADSHNQSGLPQAWPLVRLCRISHNWEVLRGGAVLVDLPGVRDANAARGRVAESYLKQCGAVWVAAEVTRAVDNASAKDLLGSTFRRGPARQMLMDGQYSNISFVSEIVLNLGACEICERSGTSPEDFAALDDAIRGLQGDQEGLEGELTRLARQVRVFDHRV